MKSDKKQNAALKQAQVILGNNIRSRRQFLSLSQEELGLRINADQAYISRLERGLFNPTLESIADIANALELDIHKLLIQ